MPWVYHQASGELYLNGVLVGTGYSGAGRSAATGRNNPAMQNVPFQGPIPVGTYQIGVPYNHPRKGATAMALTPVGHNALGRDDFMIHGDNVQSDASQGCVILGPTLRQRVASSGDNQLMVQP